jgi:deoxycytidine triphosphate deaminase
MCEIGVLVSDLTKEEIRSLITAGWSCDDYKGICKIQSHKGVKNSIVYDPTGKIPANQIADDKNFEGNAAILHIGQVVGKLTQDELTEDAMIVPPGKFVFFMTKECVNMPFDIDGSLFMNPRISNLGLHFFTLGHIDPGFHGHLTATLLNMTSQPIKLKRHEGCLYFVLAKTHKIEEPHQRFHEKPQFTIEEAQKNLSFNLNPGFALTSADFATKDDLDKWRNMLLVILFGVFGIGFSTIIGVILWLLGKIPPAQ